MFERRMSAGNSLTDPPAVVPCTWGGGVGVGALNPVNHWLVLELLEPYLHFVHTLEENDTR